MDTRTQVKQYVDIVWRRKWWVVLPTVIGVAASLYLFSSTPKLYQAGTTILVTRQSVPDDIVRSTVTTRVDEAMKRLEKVVLSRKYLQRVAEEVSLISSNADEAAIEAACDQIKKSVKLDSDKRDLSWFQITVTNRDPVRAARIANRLAEMFIDQNTENRVKQASETTNLVDNWVERKDAELRKRDDEISRYKREHMYELPDQEGPTIQLLNSAQERVSQLSSEIRQKTDRLSTLSNEANQAVAVAPGVNVVVGGDDESRQLALLERELGDLLINYTDEHPLVRKKRDQISQFKAAHPTLTATNSTDPNSRADRGSPEARRLQTELRNLESDRARAQADVNTYTARLANMPLRAQQLAELTRDYDTLKSDYDARVGQREVARRSQEVEETKKGEQFQIQDLAKPPAKAFYPVLPAFLILGLAAGLGVGGGMTALLEFLDQSVRTEEQFTGLFPDVPILGVIPNLVESTPLKPPRMKRDRAKKAAKAATGAVALFAMLGGFLA